jgi:shikimate kinase
MKSPVFICGMPGSGKSTIGKKLASRLGAIFIDLDTFVEQQTGKSPAVWITQDGEMAFRKVESQVLRNLDLKSFAVVSCGGGTPCFNGNLDWMLQLGRVVYLDLPIGMVLQRLKQAEVDERPLLKGFFSIEGLTELHEKRKLWYNRIPLIFRPHEEKLEKLVERLKSF